MPLDFVSSVLVSTVLTGALSALAYRRDVLTWDGSLAAFVVGMVIGVFGDVTWLFLLLFFLLSSFLATRYRFALKEALGVQEGLRGERKATNVLANGFAPMAAAAISLTMPAGFPKIIRGRSRRRPWGRIRSDRKSTRLNSSHVRISYAVFCLKKKKNHRSRRDEYQYI